jgi:hypothetical protein
VEIDKDQVITDLVFIVKTLVTGTLVKEEQALALGQEILDAIAEESTAVDSIIALLNGLVATNVIDAATAARIKSAIGSDRDRINAAVLANTPPPPPSSAR